MPYKVLRARTHARTEQNSTYPDAGYPERQMSGSAGPSGKLVENLQKLTCLEIIGYRIKYSTVLWLLDIQSGVVEGFRRRYIVHTVNSNSRTSDCHCSLLSKKNKFFRIFCITGCLAVPINPDKWGYTIYTYIQGVPGGMCQTSGECSLC
jgi:hypothetical protein